MKPAARPDILYLHSHDTGRYVQPYGHAVPTPNIQRFAEQGVLFRKAFCGAPTCSPSRAVLLTGQAAHTCGMFGLVNRGFYLRDQEKVLPRALQAAGYETVLSGVTHVVRDPQTLGYDRILPTSDSGPAAAKAAAEYLAGGSRRPFFLDAGFFPTHRRFPELSADDDGRYGLPPAPLPDCPETRRDMAAFKASARLLDECVGTVLHALDETDLAANTLVILTTDHGIAFPRMKCNLTDHGIGVMLILRGPGRAGTGEAGGFAGGKALDALVSQLDLFPTICDSSGIVPPAWLQGVSLLALAAGERQSVRDEVFAEVNYHCAYEPARAVRTERWKYIRCFDPHPTILLANCDKSPSKEEMLRHGWGQMPRAAEELYDLAFDPNEACNLAGDLRQGEVLREMRQRLQRWMRETDDPLLAGPIPPPPTAVVNDAHDMDPEDVLRRRAEGKS
jgi:arylsulfatase A-like enzyme